MPLITLANNEEPMKARAPSKSINRCGTEYLVGTEKFYFKVWISCLRQNCRKRSIGKDCQKSMYRQMLNHPLLSGCGIPPILKTKKKLL